MRTPKARACVTVNDCKSVTRRLGSKKILQVLTLTLFLSFLSHGTGCQPKVPKKPGAAAVAIEPAPPTGTSVELTIVGFNYTDKDINEFYADGNGGGNLFVSSASGGGGGSVCCALYTTGEPGPEFDVRWQSDACTYNIRHDRVGTEFNDIFSIYTSATVKVASVSPNPKYLEIHIFPDGHAEGAITDELSSPRLVLDQNRRVNAPFRKCPNGIRPSD